MTYLRTFSLIFVLVVGLISGFNWWIDPYGMYWSPQLDGVNQVKSQSSDRVRIIKPVRVSEVKPEILLIGNSRVEMGLDPASEQFKGKRVYNLAMPGISADRQYEEAILQLTQNAELQHIMLSVDFLDFLYVEEEVSQHLQSSWSVQGVEPMPWWQNTKDMASLLFSLDTAASSIATLFSQKGWVNHIREDGFHQPDGYLEIMRAEGIGALFRQKIVKLRSRLESQNTSLFPGAHNVNPGLEKLAAFADFARQKGVKLTVFVNPYHYSYIHLIADAGRWDEFLQWKDEVRGILTAQNIVLFDFATFSPANEEPVNTHKPQEQMAYYWEPAHYKAELGEHMLTVMLSQQANDVIEEKLAVNAPHSFNQARLHATRGKWQQLQKALFDE